AAVRKPRGHQAGVERRAIGERFLTQVLDILRNPKHPRPNGFKPYLVLGKLSVTKQRPKDDAVLLCEVGVHLDAAVRTLRGERPHEINAAVRLLVSQLLGDSAARLVAGAQDCGGFKDEGAV